jgi:hypothetical protein
MIWNGPRRSGGNTISIEVADAQGVVTMTGQFDWFLQRQDSAA